VRRGDQLPIAVSGRNFDSKDRCGCSLGVFRCGGHLDERAGIPGNGKPFPDGSKIAKIEWKPKKMVESPFAVNVPATLQDVFLIEKDSKRFPDTKGWAYAVFDYQPESDTFTPDPTGTVNCGFACHTVVKDKDYIFHSCQKR
jgi:hypothetical protein